MKKIVTTIGLAALVSIPAFVGAADKVGFNKTVTQSAQVKISKPLRELAKPQPVLTKERKFKIMASGDQVPGYGIVKEIPNRFPYKNRVMKQAEGFVDTAAQTSMKKRANGVLAPTLGVSFDGVGNINGVAPPDTNGEVGPNHYVQTVNLSMAVWDKTGNQLMAPTNTNVLWTGFGGICENQNDGDPIVLYDSAADRWLISQFALNGTDNHQCIAISTTADPTGSYFLYDFLYGALMNDYPHFGIWTDGYYMGANQFDSTNGFSFEGGGVVAYERDKMLIGAVAQQVKFDMNGSTPTVFTAMPLDMDGLLPPPAGANEYFIWSSLDSLDNLQVWEFAVDWANPGASTFTQVTSIPVTPYSSAPSITQPNGSSLDSLSIRSMFRAAYRNLDGQGKIVFTHNIAAPAGQGQTALRWYEIDVDQNAGTATLAQESTFAPDQTSRWMGSGAMDVNGNIAFGYSMASSTMEPSIGAATRLVTDPANTLTDEVMLKAGEGSQSGTSRWGDYSNLSIDPVDDCTFWFTTEYYKLADSGSIAWSTHVSSFKIPTCVAGPRGEIAGTVTDAVSGDPIPYATVTAGIGSTRTDANGNYLITLPVGNHDVSATKYGWVSNTPITVAVLEDQTVTGDVALNGAVPVVVSGHVDDAGGSGLSLYAKVSVSVPGDTIVTYTNPETGNYTVNLFEGTTVSLTASEMGVGGFLDQTISLLPSNGAPLQPQGGVDFSLAPNSNCTAPGYAFVDPAFYEGFDVFPATGWTVVDASGVGALWDSYLANGRAIAGVQPDAAMADSDAAGPGSSTDTSLVSPVITVASLSTFVLEFDGYFRPLGASRVDVDVSSDGGAWVNVGNIAGVRSLDPYAIDLTPQIGAATSFQVRFRFTAGWDWYTVVDNVRFGNRGCAPAVAGDLVSGYVVDTNNGNSLTGATVSLDGMWATTTVSTPMDMALNDGFFQVFVPATTALIEVAEVNYVTATPTVADITLATPISLDAGMIDVAPGSLSASMTAGRASADSLTVSNNGSAAADFASFFINGNPNKVINGPFDPAIRHMGPKDLNDMSAAKIRHFPEVIVDALAPGEIVGFFPTNLAFGWGVSRDRVTGEFWVGDLVLGGAAADLTWRYDAGGNLTADSIDSNFGGVFHADSTFNQRTGMLWSVNVGGDNCIHEMDTSTLTQTGNTICPAFSSSQRGLAYDPITDTFYSGSWNDGTIHQFTTDGVIIRSVNVGLPIAGLAFNSGTNHLFISANGSSGAGDFDIIVVNAASPTLVKVGGYDITLDVDGDGVGDDVISDNGQAGLDIDCNGNLWITEQNQQFVVGFQSGETGACEWNNVPWLSTDIRSGTLAAGDSTQVNVSFDSAGMMAGTYDASIVYANNTPYGETVVPVSMTLSEPQYGAPQFAVSSVAVFEQDTAVITVNRVGGSDYPISVDYSTADGSASTLSYNSTSGTLNWDDFDASPKTFTISTLNVNETSAFVVSLSNPQGGAAMGSRSVMTVTVKKRPEGGSFGIPLLMLFAMAGLLRRRKVKAK
ncbi:MAG: carboxypeptidase regulatory-like domain-containing protein [Enterobacterales bacterium]|nr:carboxypeptidase regulatory-like domain-containing protein [Enterobacterales bacterium]